MSSLEHQKQGFICLDWSGRDEGSWDPRTWLGVTETKKLSLGGQTRRLVGRFVMTEIRDQLFSLG